MSFLQIARHYSASEQWVDYAVDITNLVIWPQYPRFPGPIYFNVTANIKESLPDVSDIFCFLLWTLSKQPVYFQARIDMSLEVKQLMETRNGQMTWQTIPCHGWDVLTGCDGVGSW